VKKLNEREPLNYKGAYLYLFNAITDILDAYFESDISAYAICKRLRNAQKSTEEISISDPSEYSVEIDAAAALESMANKIKDEMDKEK
jgi:hypothetical protein